MQYATLDSPCGPLTVLSGPAGVRAVRFADPSPDPDWEAVPHLPAIEQLTAYFAGERRAFDLSLDPIGTDFQREVWALLGEVPFGHTTTYGALARKLGRPGASRAVGAANGQNPLAILVPCHRVIGGDGSLTGYAGGLERKRFLLTLEGSLQPSLFGPGSPAAAGSSA